MLSERINPVRSHPMERGFTLSLEHYWSRIGLGTILLVAAILNFIGLSREGYSNSYYAAAVKSMGENWHAFFFNSFDSAGFVTIDKPPLGFWFQVASTKLFGFNGVALLLPQALAGVLSVALLYYLVRRPFGPVAGLIAALALAITPISVVTNRNNTIDSTLVFFVLLGAWAVLRAAQTGKLRWLLLCAAFVGLGFNIKMLEAYLVLPAFGLMYLIGTHLSLKRRIGNLLLAAVVLIAISFSWIAAVDLTPASARPWVGSTSTNSALDLAIGYNGLQRLTGNRSVGGGNGNGGTNARPGATTSTSSSGSSTATAVGGTTARAGGLGGPGGGNGNAGGPGGVGENGNTGPLRLLDTQLGSQIGWLLPLAVLGLLVAAWQTRPRFRRASVGEALRGLPFSALRGLLFSAPRGLPFSSPESVVHERQRSLVLWGMWLVTTGVFFSRALFFHTYYLVMVAPAVSALAAIGVVALWAEYRRPESRSWWLLPAGLLAVAGVQAHVLADYPAWSRWLTPLVIGLCAISALALILFRIRPFARVRMGVPAVVLALGGLMAAPAAWAANTAQNTETGAILHAGPTAKGTNGAGGFGGGQPGSFGPPSGVSVPSGSTTGSSSTSSTKSSVAPRSSSTATTKSTGSRTRSATNAPQSPPSGTGSSAPPQGGPGGPPPNGGSFGPPPGNGAGTPPSSTQPGGASSSTSSATPKSGSTSVRSTTSRSARTSSTSSRTSVAGTTVRSFGAGFNRAGNGGGPGGGNNVNTALLTYLQKHRGSATYLVATSSANAAAPYILATGDPVMALGGFTGSDPILTTTKLAALVKAGTVRYFLTGGGGGPGGGNSTVSSWVQSNCTLVPASKYSSSSTSTVDFGGGSSLYDCGNVT